MYLKHNCFEVPTPPNHNLEEKIVLQRFFVTDQFRPDSRRQLSCCNPQVVVVEGCPAHQGSTWKCTNPSRGRLQKTRSGWGENPDLSKFSNPERKGKIHERLRVTRQNAKEASMPKRVPITFKINSRALFADMWMQTQVNLWLFDDAVGRKPFHAFQFSYDKIWKRLQPAYNLRRHLYRKGIRLQQRAQTIHAIYDQHRPIPWGKP